MKLKKTIVCFLIILQIFVYSACDDTKSNMTDIEKTTQAASEEAIEIYRTYTGECYHRDGCDYLRSKIATSVHEIKAKGLRPCSKCKPPCFE